VAKVERRTDNFEYWKSGFIHICVTDPDIERLCKKFLKVEEDNGARFGKLSQTKELK
jgi:hypothetical protein